MKRLAVWAISLVLGTIVTFVLFEFTPVAIPFVEGGVFTLITILLMAFLFAILIDTVTKAGIYDTRGWHLGLFNTNGPLAKDDPKPGGDYQPIVSREERRKREKTPSQRQASRH